MSNLAFKHAAAVVDVNGNSIGGSVVAPTAAAGGYIDLLEATANGTNRMRMQAPSSLAANRAISLTDRDYDLTDIAQRAEQITRAVAGTGSILALPEATGNGTDELQIQAPAALTGNRAVTWSDRAFSMSDLAARAERITLGSAGVRGSVSLQEDSANGSNVTVIRSPASLGADRTVDLPDATVTFPAGAGGASTLVDQETSQTISAPKTWNTATFLLKDQANGASRITVLGPANLTGDRVYTLADAAVTFPAGVGNVSSLMDLETAQAVTGVKTFNSSSVAIKDQAGGANVLSLVGPANLTGNRALNLPDASVTFPAGAAATSTLMDLQTAQAITSEKTTTQGIVDGTPLIIGGRGADASGGTTVTNTAAETASRTYIIPAGTLTQGRVLRVKFGVRAVSTNANDTMQVRLRLGGVGGTALITTTAVDVSNNDNVVGEFRFTAAAAPGVAVAVNGVGSCSNPFAGGGAQLSAYLAPTNFNTSIDLDLVVTIQWSAPNVGNQAICEFFDVEQS